MNDPESSLFEINTFLRNDFDTEKEWIAVQKYINVLLTYIKEDVAPGREVKSLIYMTKSTRVASKDKVKVAKSVQKPKSEFKKRLPFVVFGKNSKNKYSKPSKKKGGNSNMRGDIIHKQRKITQKRSLHKKYNKTSKKNKRPARKTQRRRN
jgi:hypothetical protein